MKISEEEDFNKIYDKYKGKIVVTANKYYQISQSMRTLDFMISRNDLQQEGTIILYNCWKHYKELPDPDFNRLFKKSLETGVLKKAKGRKNNNIYIDMTTDRDIRDINDTGSSRNSQLATGYNELKNKLFTSPFKQIKEEKDFGDLIERTAKLVKTDLSRAVLDELAYPSPRTLLNAILDVKRKKMMKKQKKGNYVPKNISIQYQYIYHSLNITKQQFDYAMKDIKSAVLSILNSEKVGNL